MGPDTAQKSRLRQRELGQRRVKILANVHKTAKSYLGRMEETTGKSRAALPSAKMCWARRSWPIVVVEGMSGESCQSRASKLSELIAEVSGPGQGNQSNWRTERDSNPRWACTHTRVPGVRLQPLGHLPVRTRGYKHHSGLSKPSMHTGM